MSPDTAMSCPVYGLSDRALDQAWRMVGGFKLAIRRQMPWQPILFRMEQCGDIRHHVSEAHRDGCEQLRPYNRRMGELLEEMIRRQFEQARGRSKKAAPPGEEPGRAA